MAEPETPLLTVDGVIVTPQGVVLIRRARPPFAGRRALPGGFVERGETVEAACAREVAEETGLRVDPGALRLVGVYSDPGRDPRGHSVSVAFTVRSSGQGLTAGDDAAAVEVVADWRAEPLAFDHAEILEDALHLWPPAPGAGAWFREPRPDSPAACPHPPRAWRLWAPPLYAAVCVKRCVRRFVCPLVVGGGLWVSGSEREG